MQTREFFHRYWRLNLRSFVFYGLDLTDKLLAAETLRADRIEDARLLARHRLAEFPKVELWAETICVYRNRRAPEGPTRKGH
jgi:hypothetical protein